MKWLNRSQEKILAAEYPIGNPFGGPAYGEKTDFGSAIGAGASLLGGAMSSKSNSKAADKAAKASQQATNQAMALQKEMYDQSRSDNEPWRQAGGNALSRLLTGIGIYDSSSKSLVDRSGGDWKPNDQLYGTNDSYRNAWDKFISEHYDKYKTNPNDVKGSIWNDAELTSRGYVAQDPKDAEGFNDLIRAFSMQDYVEDPGYQFRLSEGMRGLDRSAAARGGLQSGAALKAAANYAEDAASQEYGNAYNRYNNDQTNQFNRLASVAGLGQTANTLNANYGSNYANNVSGNIMNNADNQANSYLAQGNSRGSAYSGIGNALGSMASKWGKNNYDYDAYNSTSDPLGAMGYAQGWWK